MRVRTIALLTAVLFAIAAVIGLVNRSSFTNYTAEGLESFNVAVASDELIDRALDGIEADLSNSRYILRVRADSGMQYTFKCTEEPVTVLEVYKGDGVQVGEQIKIVRDNSRIFFDETREINMNFVNEMKAGDEYLVFLSTHLESKAINNQNVYMTSEFLITPIFSYSDRENTPVVPEDMSYTVVPYTEVENNEFFAVTQYGIDRLNELKAKLLEQYPAS